jgi:hypothetical protein
MEPTLRKSMPRGLRVVVPESVEQVEFVNLGTGQALREPGELGMTWHGVVSLHAEVRAREMHTFVLQTESMIEEIQCAAAWHGDRWDIFDVLVRLGDVGFECEVTRVDGKPLGPIAGLEFYIDKDAEPPYLILHALEPPPDLA